jgi:hypothetical protein
LKQISVIKAVKNEKKTKTIKITATAVVACAAAVQKVQPQYWKCILQYIKKALAKFLVIFKPTGLDCHPLTRFCTGITP